MAPSDNTQKPKAVKTGRKKIIMVKKKKKPEEKKPEVKKPEVKFQNAYFTRLRSFLNDYLGNRVKEQKGKVHRKIMDMEEKFTNIHLKKSSAKTKKGKELTATQKKSVMDSIDYLDKLYNVNIKKGKTGLVVS